MIFDSDAEKMWDDKVHALVQQHRDEGRCAVWWPIYDHRVVAICVLDARHDEPANKSSIVRPLEVHRFQIVRVSKPSAPALEET